MIRFGLCCKFEKEPIKFYTTTVSSLKKLDKKETQEKLSDICMKNAQALKDAIVYCSQNNIGSFRVNSQILPAKTHPDVSYEVADLSQGKEIVQNFKDCKSLAQSKNIRLTFHPDQFILLSSPSEEVTLRSIADLEYQAQVSEWIGADVINIHGGGSYGDKKSALKRVEQNLKRLSKPVLSRLTFENDDKIYTPADLLPVCKKSSIPFVYDVHHHRCNPDGLTIEQVTKEALKTWNREPLFHVSSPKEGWKGPKPARHHDFINKKDFPSCWMGLNITVEVEAKAKELAIQKLIKTL